MSDSSTLQAALCIDTAGHVLAAVGAWRAFCNGNGSYSDGAVAATSYCYRLLLTLLSIAAAAALTLAAQRDAVAAHQCVPEGDNP